MSYCPIPYIVTILYQITILYRFYNSDSGYIWYWRISYSTAIYNIVAQRVIDIMADLARAFYRKMTG